MYYMEKINVKKIRTRQEIEKEIKNNFSLFDTGGYNSDENTILILEVVLDIRDLLLNNNLKSR